MTMASPSTRVRPLAACASSTPFRTAVRWTSGWWTRWNGPPARCRRSSCCGLPFRQGTIDWATEAKARHIRVFPTDSSIAVTSQILHDTTITIEANKNITLMLVGSQAAGGKVSFVKIDDSVAPAGNQMRHPPGECQQHWPGAGRRVGVRHRPTLPRRWPPRRPSRTWRPVRRRRTSCARRWTPSTCGHAGRQYGDRVERARSGWRAGQRPDRGGRGLQGPGSALSAYLFPRSVAGTKAPQSAAFTRPGVVFFVDLIPAPPQ